MSTIGCSPHGDRRLPLFLLANPLHDSLSVQDAPDTGVSSFRPRHETKPIELFYDLFFIANLTVFSIDHEINNGSSASARKIILQIFCFNPCVFSVESSACMAAVGPRVKLNY